MLSAAAIIILAYLGFGATMCNPGCGGGSSSSGGTNGYFINCGPGSDGGNGYMGGNGGGSGVVMNCSPSIGGGGAGYNPFTPGGSGTSGGFIPGHGNPSGGVPTVPVVPQPVMPQPVMPQPVMPQPVVPQPVVTQPVVTQVTQPPVVVTQVTPPPVVPTTKCTTQTIEECEEVPPAQPSNTPGESGNTPGTVTVSHAPPTAPVATAPISNVPGQVQCVVAPPQPVVYSTPSIPVMTVPVSPPTPIVPGVVSGGISMPGSNGGGVQMNCTPTNGGGGGSMVKPSKPVVINGGSGGMTGCKVYNGSSTPTCYCEPSGGISYGGNGGGSGGSQVNCDDLSNDIKACEQGNFMLTTNVLGVNLPTVTPIKPSLQPEFTSTCDECVCK
ncbi:hypothetical protein TCON_0466 [Astathelohania contejeani]|uniref:Uncharacterized protein n=1 Tax=Astathelohania contejeani TaxID=164912 RepID=A0ABQ7I1P4_9MICR|nr:hypothetical protein TCON_0466 [Thelohania contejeani]